MPIPYMNARWIFTIAVLIVAAGVCGLPAQDRGDNLLLLTLGGARVAGRPIAFPR